jgi:hypothetical protein
MTNPTKFLQFVSADARTKFLLAWLSFAFVVVPAAVLMTLGVQSRYVLVGTAALIVPFQYIAFVAVQRRNRRAVIIKTKGGPLLSEASGLAVLEKDVTLITLSKRMSVSHSFLLRLSSARPQAKKGTFSITQGEPEQLSDANNGLLLKPPSQVCYTRA